MIRATMQTNEPNRRHASVHIPESDGIPANAIEKQNKHENAFPQKKFCNGRKRNRKLWFSQIYPSRVHRKMSAERFKLTAKDLQPPAKKKENNYFGFVVQNDDQQQQLCQVLSFFPLQVTCIPSSKKERKNKKGIEVREEASLKLEYTHIETDWGEKKLPWKVRVLFRLCQ